MTLILLYQTEQEAINALEHLENVARQLWAEEGYPVTEEGVISRDARTGQENPNAITKAWDTVKAHPDGGYFFSSINNNPAFQPYAHLLHSGSYQEIEFSYPTEEEEEV